METFVVVRCRQQDIHIVEGLSEEITDVYESIVKKKVIITLDSSYLPSETTGGVELLAQKGRIKISNTLEARLELIAQQLIPQIRTALFGRNLNRKFTD